MAKVFKGVAHPRFPSPGFVDIFRGLRYQYRRYGKKNTIFVSSLCTNLRSKALVPNLTFLWSRWFPASFSITFEKEGAVTILLYQF
jgi:hypothetical protein